MRRTRTIRPMALVLAGLAAMTVPAGAAEDGALLRMAACQDSWADWTKSDPDKLKALGDHFRAGYAPHGNDAYFVPKAKTSIAGLNIAQVFPGSVGMGVGLSILVDATFDKAKATFEGVLKKKVTKCEASEGTHDCELAIAEKRTFMLMTADNDKGHTLAGCYYYYEK